ncbi:hypothetical protein REC12_17305 [Desulfosporosinus sp. PR]|uniref:hypothetical protein n=1 Tax=Candidatus Desulfosporosinus nitrosoreducens TaxID=3401928 RepID=UPI0027E647EB|nr:hypothetical protein [Desulfosporosinus sp. PR]MDQ7095351.1 hypothetical protein [Desulfosporosinus sp. PR]
MKIINLAIFTLTDYFRRTWFYAEIILVAILLFLFRDTYRLLGKNDIYPALGMFSIVLSAVTVWRIASLETNPRIYILLTKAISRTSYPSGKILAAFSLNALIVILLFIAGFFCTAVKEQLSFPNGLARLIPLGFILLMANLIMLCCSSLVFSKLSFFWGILLLILGTVQPFSSTGYLFPPIRQLIAGSYASFDIHLIFSCLLALGYIVLFYFLALYFFKKRELNYEQK